MFLLIMLWAMGAILGLPGKKKNESGSFIALATVMNAASIVGYILCVALVGLIWHSP